MLWKIALPFLAAMLAVGLGQLVGGVNPINPNDPGFQQAMKFAIKEYNHHSVNHYFYGLANIIKAQSQVVSGLNYIMTLKLGKTKCSKNSDGKKCPIIRNKSKAAFIKCDFTVWSRPWLKNMKMILTESSCRKASNGHN